MVGFKSKFSEQIGVGVAKLATENLRCQVLSWDAHVLLRCQMSIGKAGRRVAQMMPHAEFGSAGVLRPFEFERNF